MKVNTPIVLTDPAAEELARLVFKARQIHERLIALRLKGALLGRVDRAVAEVKARPLVN